MTLGEFFEKNKRCALGYSGGVDSAYLLYKGILCGADIKPYFVKSEFTTSAEEVSAVRFAENLGVPVEVIDVDVLSVDGIRDNGNLRCYHCKKYIFGAVCERANYDGYDVILEGTNASDDIDDRPGYKAISELGVVSPLKLCGITKDEIRRELREAGFEIWQRPATACLATRIPTGVKITKKDLRRIETAEELLRKLGFNDFRVRLFNNAAKLQLKKEQFCDAIEKNDEICELLLPYFDGVLLDLKER